MKLSSEISRLLWQGERRAGMKVVIAGSLVVAVAYAGLLGAWFRACRHDACPTTENLTIIPLRQTSTIYAADGSQIAELGAERRTFIALNEMAPILKSAFLVTEDRRFYRHHGVDYLRVLGAIGANISRGRLREGFSTITMQLARNLWPESIDGRERTMSRKVREIQVAYRIEKKYTKDRILELYLNQIPLGGQVFGVEPASREYFGKSASSLNVAEAALLAALPKGPTSYNPRRFPARAVARRNLILDLLRDDGQLTASEAASWKTYPLRLVPERIRSSTAPYFTEYVRQAVEQRMADQLRVGGLKIFTTLDPAIQRSSEHALEGQLASIERGRYGRYPRRSYQQYLASRDGGEEPEAAPYLQGMVLVQEAATGRVVAMVGGRDFETSKFNRATQAHRQAGSAFKPFVYSAAVRQGAPLSRLVDDEPISIQSDRVGEADWSPNNSDYQFQGAITLREALYRSRNAATVRLGMDIGLSSVIAEAKRFGLTTPIRPYPSTLLGTSEVIPMELVSAYSAFANGGERTLPRVIERIEDREGVVLWESHTERSSVMDPAQAWLLTNALRDVVRRGTAYGAVTGAGFRYPSGGKTGTSDDYADNWYIGFTSDYVTGVWIGMDRRERIMQGAQGGKLAAPVWTTIMEEVYQHHAPPTDWLEPPGIAAITIDRSTGFLATPDCPGELKITEYFLYGTEPQQYCPIHAAPVLIQDAALLQPTN
ncbi:MAG: PBP1A family penicillin-binding protein [Gemmatimonadota bacterium]